MSNLEDVMDRIKRDHAHVKAVFRTESGIRAMMLLEEMFTKQALFDKDPCVTAYRVGQHDVVKFINDLLESKHDDT